MTNAKIAVLRFFGGIVFRVSEAIRVTANRIERDAGLGPRPIV